MDSKLVTYGIPLKTRREASRASMAFSRLLSLFVVLFEVAGVLHSGPPGPLFTMPRTYPVPSPFSTMSRARTCPPLLSESRASVPLALGFVADRAPGVGAAWLIAEVAAQLADRTALSPLLWASLLGIGAGCLLDAGSKAALKQGVSFAKARLLRAGIILYGVKLTLQQVASVGLAGLFADLFSVVSTMLLGVLVGTSALGLEAPLAALIASGAAICGCSAVVAVQPVVEGEAHETAAAVGTVVACGTLAMFLYPALFRTVPFLAANPKLMAIYTGSTVHELAGVVAASAAMGSDVSATAIVTKLVRVCLLAPTLLLMSTMPSLRRRKDPAANAQVTPFRVKTPLPWFALGFVGVAALNSVVTFDRALVKTAAKVSAACLAMAMAALGFDADLGKIRQLGVKPLLLATLLWAWLLFVGGGVSRLLVLAFP